MGLFQAGREKKKKMDQMRVTALSLFCIGDTFSVNHSTTNRTINFGGEIHRMIYTFGSLQVAATPLPFSSNMR